MAENGSLYPLLYREETMTVEEATRHCQALGKALASDCVPFWHDGILGPAWHCGCEGTPHAYDSQCSVVKFYKEKSN